ncbi:hypothetical protein [Streptomyces sp. NPDC050388]|uniref:hypothetical protein n=1 Tax=Streptomyces sp. NPDC050388 TaxID=3155781 RepID=UPI00341D21CF
MTRARSPFTDEVARALADEANLQQLAERHDPDDQGLRDMWEAIVYTGRRAGEILNLKLECLGRYNGLPMLWHDQTKVGNDDALALDLRHPQDYFQRLWSIGFRATELARAADDDDNLDEDEEIPA